jgi:hypothetical protein
VIEQVILNIFTKSKHGYIFHLVYSRDYLTNSIDQSICACDRFNYLDNIEATHMYIYIRGRKRQTEIETLLHLLKPIASSLV